MKYKAAVIGCGRIGCAFDDDPKRTYAATHAGAYHGSENISLVALADVDEEKLQKYGSKYGIPPESLYTDSKEMLRKERPDIVSVCTWSSHHLEMTEHAVASGVKAVFCEKPIAESVADANKMIQICREGGVLLFIDHQRRFDPFHQEVGELIRGGRLGDVQQAHVYYTAGIANTGSHIFDLLRFFLGDAGYVRAQYSRSASPNANDPNIDGLVMFKNGVLCSLQACDVKEYLILEFDVLCTAGRLRITHSGFDMDFYEADESHLFSGYRELYPADKPVDTTAPKQFMVKAVEHIVNCLEGREQPVSSGEDGAAALELVAAFHESAEKSGAKVALPLEDPTRRLSSR